MVTAKANRDDCPVPSCDEEVSLCLITTESTKLTTQNLTHERTCITPTTHDGEPAIYIVYHEELAPPADRLDTPEYDSDPDPDEDSESDDAPRNDEDLVEHINEADLPDPDDLEGDTRTVYRRLVQVTVDGSPVDVTVLAGKLITDDISPSACEDIADSLIEDGYAIETEDGLKPLTG